MNISAIIDIICVYLNSITSFFTTLQNIKNEFHSQPTDYANILLRLLSSKTITPLDVGVPCVINDFEESLVAALVSLVVYNVEHEDWTHALHEPFNQCLPRRLEHWHRGKLRPRTINLQENHYMTSSKAKVYLAVYKPLSTIVLSLPGTNSRSDWLSNLHSATTDLVIDGKIVRVHRGFMYIAYCLSTHPQIKAFLSQARQSGITKLLLCGHSQAGAVVSLLSVLLDYDFHIRVITFGSGAAIQAEDMRVADCTSYIRTTYDVKAPVNQFWQIDPVPLMDDASLSRSQAGSMYPMGKRILLLDDGRYSAIRILQKGELKKLINLMVLNFSPSPHSMSGYLSAIMRLSPLQEIEDDNLAMQQLMK